VYQAENAFHPVLVAAVDIGSPARGRLGWYANPEDKKGQDIELLVETIADGLA
jgi:hypothetical protein